MMISCSPEATASSTTYWMVGLSTSGSISLGWALVTGRKRVPRPAAGKMARRTAGLVIPDNVPGDRVPGPSTRSGRAHGTDHRQPAAHAPRGRGRALLHSLDDHAHGAD